MHYQSKNIAQHNCDVPMYHAFWEPLIILYYLLVILVSNMLFNNNNSISKLQWMNCPTFWLIRVRKQISQCHCTNAQSISTVKIQKLSHKHTTLLWTGKSQTGKEDRSLCFCHYLLNIFYKNMPSYFRA
jgi:hypothetical protein